MSTLKIILFLALNDLKVVLKERNTILWLFIMPPIFFFFLGTVTGGSPGLPTEQPVPILVENNDPEYLGRHLEARLVENNFEILNPDETTRYDEDGEALYRTLIIPADFSEKALKGEKITLVYEGLSAGLGNNYDQVRLQKAALTVLGDIIITRLGPNELATEDAIKAMLEVKPLTTLDITSAGKRAVVPTGFEQAIPGTMVMFTLLILLTSGAASLVQERDQQLLRRLASAPFSRGQIVAGKWTGRMGLAIVQVGTGVAIGSIFFDMNWGNSLPMVLAILFGWAALCTSLALLLGSVGKSEGQVTGFGVLGSMVLAAIGGCWWPIEIAPEWMQQLQIFTPTGWTMDALHKLISFGLGPESVLLNLGVLLLAALGIGALAARKFRFI